MAAAEQFSDSLAAHLQATYARSLGALRAAEPDNGQAVILVLDSVEINRRVVRATLEGEGWQIVEASHPLEGFEALRRHRVDLIVLEMTLPDVNGPEFCRAVKAARETRFIPVLMTASAEGAQHEIAGLAAGADEFMHRPVHPAVLRARIRAMLRHKAAVDSLEEAESILFALAQAVEHRDSGTSGHCERLSMLSATIGSALGLPRPQILALHRGGYLHDIGKIAIPDAILFKPGALTEEEWAVMRTHAARGEEICRPARTLAPVLPIIRSHHERWDGTGYPDGLRGGEIPLLARILQTADVYDALTSVRPYKPALAPSEALAIMDAETAKGWRDSDLMAVLHELCAAGQRSERAAGEEQPERLDGMFRSLDNMRRALARESDAGVRAAG